MCKGYEINNVVEYRIYVRESAEVRISLPLAVSARHTLRYGYDGDCTDPESNLIGFEN